MKSSAGNCTVSIDSAAPLRPLLIQNDLLSATILLDKGADIYQLIFKPKNIDVFWKTPWGLKRAGPGVPSCASSTPAWMEAYAGGWQEIFPNGGGSCVYKGAELNMHGEASMTSWDAEILEAGGAGAAVRLTTRLARSPFRIERTMRVEQGRAVLELIESITNEGDESMAYMWGHHPALGAPFLGPACRIDHDARSIRADDEYDPPFNPMELDRVYRWPSVERGGRAVDLSHVPPRPLAQAMLGYLLEFNSGWYGVTNTEMGIGFGMTWPIDIFPYAWMWQELSASSGYPWYRAAYTMAIEPFSSIPGRGLVTAIERNTHRTLEPGESISADVNAVLYESRNGISKLNKDGTVMQRT